MFLADVGGSRWEALWDVSTGVPLRIFGEGIAAPGTSANAAAAESHARDFIARHGALVAPGIAPENLTLSANVIEKGLRTVAFVESAPMSGGGLDLKVIRGQLSFRYKNDRLIVIASEIIPHAKATPAKMSPQAAENAAMKWMATDFNGVKLSGKADLVVLPLIRAKSARPVTVWRVPVEVGSLPFKYHVYVDAGSGEPVARELLGRFLQATAAYDVSVRYPQGERKLFTPSLAQIGINGVKMTTDNAGLFSWEGPGDASVELSVKSDGVFVYNHSGADAVGTFSAADGGQVAWSMADDQLGDAQLSTFIHAAIVKERARLIAPELNFVLQKLTANVNRDGSSINFFVEYQPCNNTGRLADVIYHEFGHGFHQNSIILGAGQMDPALGEGQSDYLACTITGDPKMGPGFFTNGGVLRNCENDRRWPDDIDFDPHETGLIFTGAMWDLRGYLTAEFGPEKGVAHADALYHAAIQRSSNVPATYAEVLAADDDDGDLANGTPNICAINRAFVRHGLSPYLSAGGLTLRHEAISRLPVSSDPYPVKVTQELLYPQCGEGDVDSVKLLWGPGDTTNKVTLTQQGDEFTGAIPAQAGGVGLRYRIIATVDGNERTLPDNPADPEYRVFVGDVTPLYCNDFEDAVDGWEFSSDSGGTGDFKWGEPEGLAEDPDAAHSGSRVIGNDLGVNGTYAAEKGSYAKSPAINLAGNKKVRLQFWRWLAVEDGYYDQAIIKVNGKDVWENDGTDESFGALHHIDKEWRFEDIDISWIAIGGGQTAQVEFGLESDQHFEAGGWTIDDFCVVAVPEPVVEPTTGVGGAGGAGGTGGGGGPIVIDQGCGCRTAGDSAPAGSPFAGLAAGGLLLSLAARRRRRRS
jgi:MYXO-CTERM domain-containing protein